MVSIRKTIAVAISVVALLLAFAMPVAAHGGHGSCQGFGEFYKDWATGGYLEAGFTNPGFAPFTLEGPNGEGRAGALAAWIALEHELFCAPR